MTIEEMIAILQAYKEGKTIQWKGDYAENWKDCEEEPCWDFNNLYYRIKPEPHYRPFESAEEVIKAIKEHGDWVKYEGDYYRIIAVTRAKVYYGGVEEGESFYKAVANTFLDGTPFGKLVEE